MRWWWCLAEAQPIWLRGPPTDHNWAAALPSLTGTAPTRRGLCDRIRPRCCCRWPVPSRPSRRGAVRAAASWCHEPGNHSSGRRGASQAGTPPVQANAHVRDFDGGYGDSGSGRGGGAAGATRSRPQPPPEVRWRNVAARCLVPACGRPVFDSGVHVRGQGRGNIKGATMRKGDASQQGLGPGRAGAVSHYHHHKGRAA